MDVAFEGRLGVSRHFSSSTKANEYLLNIEQRIFLFVAIQNLLVWKRYKLGVPMAQLDKAFVF